MARERSAIRKQGYELAEGAGRRREKRVHRRLMVRFGVAALDKTAYTKNISEAGLFIHTNSVLKPGTTIQVQIQFPDRTFVHWATITWGMQAPPQLAHVVGCGMGARFLDPGQEWIDYFRKWSTTARVS